MTEILKRLQNVLYREREGMKIMHFGGKPTKKQYNITNPFRVSKKEGRIIG